MAQKATPQTIALMRKANYTDAEIEEELGVGLSPAQDILHCEIGNHEWKRDKRRGKKPRNCPKHQPVALIKSTTRTLRCQLGDHDWEAPRKKGKGPANCPEHRPTPIIDLNKMQDGRRHKAQIDRETTIREIISAPNARNCRCGIDPSMNDLELRSLCERSCTSPGGICSVLDRCMRRVYTYA